MIRSLSGECDGLKSQDLTLRDEKRRNSLSF